MYTNIYFLPIVLLRIKFTSRFRHIECQCAQHQYYHLTVIGNFPINRHPSQFGANIFLVDRSVVKLKGRGMLRYYINEYKELLKLTNKSICYIISDLKYFCLENYLSRVNSTLKNILGNSLEAQWL